MNAGGRSIPFSRMGRIAAEEALRTVLIVGGMALTAAVLARTVFAPPGGPGGGFADGTLSFLSRCHLNRNGVPLGPEVLSAARQTLPLVVPAIGLLAVGATGLAAFIVESPRWRFLRYAVLAVSAVPSFIFPFLGFLLLPERRFPGFADVGWGWGAAALAVGDLNLYAITLVACAAIRRERAQPYVELLEAMGRSRLTDLWPRVLVAVLTALAARIPYLLGSTICLEMLLDIPGLGLAAWRAIVEVPADPAMLLWICGLGVVLSRTISLVCRLTELALLPQHWKHATTRLEGRPAAAGSESDGDDTPATESVDGVPTRPAAASVRRIIVPGLSSTAQEPRRRLRFGPCRRILFYMRSEPHALSQALTAGLILSALAIGALWTAVQTWAGPPPPAAEFLLPGPGIPWGTDINGESVLHVVVDGFQQQFVPLLLALCLATPLSVVPVIAGHLSGLLAGRPARFLAGLSWLAGTCSEFVESLPKLIVLLAAVSWFDADHLLLKLYGVMGLLFAPQLFRALSDELAPLKDAAYLEAMRTMRVPILTILRNNLLRHHVVPVLLIQSALIVGMMIHADALIGFAGERKPGGVRSWGSILGFGTEQYLQIKPLQGILAFNDRVLAGPLIAVWSATVTAFVIADVLKIVMGGHVRRR